MTSRFRLAGLDYCHICIEGHGLTREEVEEVLQDETSDSKSSGRPTAFGWTSAGDRIAVVFEEMSDDLKLVYPITAYRVPPKRDKKGKRR